MDVGYTRNEIVAGIQHAIAPVFREKMNDLVNPYGDGNAAERIINRLKSVALDDQLIRKYFCDLGVTE